MYGKHRFPGRRFIVEGIDGSGKSTQLSLLKKMAGVGRLCRLFQRMELFTDDLVTRVLQSGGFDYWESGMDLRMGEDFYESFIRYQKWLLAEFAKRVEPYGFNIIDASASVEDVITHLRGRFDKVIVDNGI